MNSFMLMNKLQSNKQNTFHCNIGLFGFSQSGLLYSSSFNSTFYDKDSFKCINQQQQKVYDPRCQYWYSNATQNDSTSFNPPIGLAYQDDVNSNYPSLVQLICQKLVLSNSNTINHVFCFQMNLTQLSFGLQAFQSNNAELILLDFTSQSIVYDQKNNQHYFLEIVQSYNIDNKSITQFNDYLNRLLKESKQNYNSINYRDLLDLNQNSQLNIQFSNNSTQQMMISNPIYIIDKQPELTSQSNQENTLNYLLPYLQIGIISKGRLQKVQEQLVSLSLRISYWIFFVNFIIFLIEACVTLYDFEIIITQMEEPFTKIMNILEKSLKQGFSNINDDLLIEIINDEDNVVFSNEIYDLSLSIYQVIQILKQITESLFNADEATNLIRLNNNIKFFEVSENYLALGVTHNNIGSILANQEQYFQAFEHLQQSVIYARYEIQEFCKKHPTSKSVHFLKKFCYIDEFKDLNNSLVENKAIKRKGFLCKILQIFKKKENEQQTQKQQKEKVSLNHQDNKLLDLFGNDLFFRHEEQFQSKLKEDPLYGKRVELILTFFYRKLNFAFIMGAYQDKIEGERRDKQQQSKQFVQYYNFWDNLVKIYEELLNIAEDIQLPEPYFIMLYSQLKMCYTFIGQEKRVTFCKEQIQKYTGLYIISSFTIGSENLTELEKIKEIIQQTNIFQSVVNKQDFKSDNEQSLEASQLLKFSFRNPKSKKTILREKSPGNCSVMENSSLNYQVSPSLARNRRKSSNQGYNFGGNEILEETDDIFIGEEKNFKVDQQIEDAQSFHRLKRDYSNKKSNMDQSLLNSNRLQNNILCNMVINKKDAMRYQYFKDNYSNFSELHVRNQSLFEKQKILVEGVECFQLFTELQVQMARQNYKTAATILTNLLEKCQALLLPNYYVIFRELKNLFEMNKIYCKEIDQLNQKCNQRTLVSLHCIYSTSNSHQNWVFSYLLSKELFAKIITSKQDEFGVIEIREDEQYVQSSLQTMPLQSIEYSGHLILQMLLESYLTSYDRTYTQMNLTKNYQLENFLLDQNQQIAQSIQYNTNMQKGNQDLKKKVILKSTSLINQQDSLTKSNKFIFNKKIQENKIIFTRGSTNKLFSKQESLNKSKLKDEDSQSGYQTKGYIDNQNLILSPCRCLNDEQKEEENTPNKEQHRIPYERMMNKLFHQAVKQILVRILPAKKVSIKYLEDCLNRRQQSRQFEQEENLNVLDEQKYTQKDFNCCKRQEYIIYTTNKLYLNEDRQFRELCILLSKYTIQILILSHNPGDNFLEKQNDKIYTFNGYDVIRVFNDISKLVNYLAFQKISFVKHPIQTLFQHY